MSSAITLGRIRRINPPIYEGAYEGRPLRVQLDSSAVLKLEGSLSFEKLPELLESKRPIVAKAAQRLIQLRKADRTPAPGASLHAASVPEPIVVTLSALDLD